MVLYFASYSITLHPTIHVALDHGMGVKESNSCAQKTRKRDRHKNVLRQNKMYWNVRVITIVK